MAFANCNYIIEDVTFDKAVAFENEGKVVSLKNVTINETHDYYAMWITAEGQTVNIDGLEIISAGRGIKIDEQYVDAPAKVTLNIAGAEFTTAKKAAIVVKSVSGAEINWGTGNDISNVQGDNTFAVWVDEDSKAYAGNVIVNGAYVKVEGSNDAVIVNSREELSAALADGTVKDIYLASGDFGTIVAKSNKTIIGSANAKVDCVNLNGANKLTLKNIVFNANDAQLGYDGKGTVRYYANIITGDNVNKPTKGAHNLVIDGCTFEGTFVDGGAAIAFADRNRGGGFSGNVTIKNCKFNTTNAYYDIYGYYCGDGINGYGDWVIENNQFLSSTASTPVYLGRYASSTPVVVSGNNFAMVSSIETAVYLQDHGSYGVSLNATGNTFAQ
jgi:hypothetical protein